MRSGKTFIPTTLNVVTRPRACLAAVIALATAWVVLPTVDEAFAAHRFGGGGGGGGGHHGAQRAAPYTRGTHGSFRANGGRRGNVRNAERGSFAHGKGTRARTRRDGGYGMGGGKAVAGRHHPNSDGNYGKRGGRIVAGRQHHPNRDGSYGMGGYGMGGGRIVAGRQHHPNGDGGYGRGPGKIVRPHRPTGDGRIVTSEPGRRNGDRYPSRWHPRFPRHPYLPPVVVNNPPSTGGVAVGGGNGSGNGPPSRVIGNSGSGGGGGGGASGNPATRRAGSGVPPANEQRYVPDEVVLELASGITEQDAQAIAARFQLLRLDSYTSQLSGTTVVRWRIPDGRAVPAVVQALEADGTVISAQPNYLFTLTQERDSQTSTEEGDPAQYALAKLHLGLAHALAKGKVKVAVIDSGVDISNPDLAGDIAGSFDPIGKGEKVHPHGTGVAGVIAAHGRLMGAAPAAQLLVVRAFSDAAGDDGTTFAITRGLDWAAAQGARIINMSFTGPQDPEIARNIASAYDKGIVLVAAMGNKGPDSEPLYPAADEHVIAVTATDAEDALPEFASRGNHVAVAAPGVDLMMLAPKGLLQFSSGTSFSAPYVTGVIALMIERRPDLSPIQVRKTLMQTAKDLGPKGFDPGFGAGLVDAYKALMALTPTSVGTASR